MEDAQGQQIAKVKDNYSTHDYQILAPDGSIIAQIHKKWVTIRDAYNIEITGPGFDHLLSLSNVIVRDHVEQKTGQSRSYIGPFSF